MKLSVGPKGLRPRTNGARVTHVMAAFLLLLAVTGARGETAYVTDRLQLGLHRAPDTSDRPFRTLESGQELEILSRNRNYAQVRLPDGTAGYVKVAYTVSEKPAALIVAEARAETERLTRELAQAKAEFAEPAAAIEDLKLKVSEQDAMLAQAAEKVEELTTANERYLNRQEQYQYSLPLTWVSGAMVVCLVAGILGGIWWIDYRSRKRHGGIRIY